MDTNLASGKFPSQSATTVIVYGNLHKRSDTMDRKLEHCIEHQLSSVPESVNELILAHHIPSEYLNVIYTHAIYEFGIKRLTFFAYKTTSKSYFLQPCDDFVSLEELTFEQTDLQHFDLRSCRDLKKLHILNANYFNVYDVSTYFTVDNIIVDLNLFGR